MTPLNQWSARRRGRYPHNTQQTEETIIRVLIWIQTRDPSSQAAADLHRRPHGRRDRQVFVECEVFFSLQQNAEAVTYKKNSLFAFSAIYWSSLVQRVGPVAQSL